MKAAPANPVPPEAREKFAKRVRYWQERFGLTDWRINVSTRTARRGVMAEVVKRDYEARMASIRLGADFGSTPVTDQALDELACHEMLHVFLYELQVLCKDSNTSADVIASAEHRVINTLEILLSVKAP